jgi:cytochrome c556
VPLFNANGIVFLCATSNAARTLDELRSTQGGPMRTSLFLSTLFAVSMVGGVALAEKPHDWAAAKEPRSIELLRAHGDVVDKVYSAPADRGSSQAGSQVSQLRVAQPATRARFDRSANRINCSDTGADCAAHSAGSTHAGGLEASPSQTGRAAHAPAFLDKVLGNDRTNFNEADQDEGMSPRAANRAWAHAATDHHGAAGVTALSGPAQVDRKEQQASSARMSCNDADECSMSIKAAKQEWAKSSIKAGTWTGPAREPISNAALRIAAQRAAEGATGKGSQGREHAGAAGASAGASAGAEHDH